MKYLICFMFLFFFNSSIYASDTLSSPLITNLDWKIVAVNSSITIAALGIESMRNKPTNYSMALRQKSFNIPSWDIHAKDLNESWDLMSDVGAYGSFVLPAGWLLQQVLRGDAAFFQHSMQYVETTWMTVSATMLLKYAIYRPRPFTYNKAWPSNVEFKKRDSASFTSGHTAIAASNCMFFYLNLKDSIKNRWMRHTLLGVSLAVPAWVGYSRMEAGQHFLSDVCAGYLVGVASSFLIYKLHRQESCKILMSAQSVGIQWTFG